MGVTFSPEEPQITKQLQDMKRGIIVEDLIGKKEMMMVINKYIKYEGPIK